MTAFCAGVADVQRRRRRRNATRSPKTKSCPGSTSACRSCRARWPWSSWPDGRSADRICDDAMRRSRKASLASPSARASSSAAATTRMATPASRSSSSFPPPSAPPSSPQASRPKGSMPSCSTALMRSTTTSMPTGRRSSGNEPGRRTGGPWRWHEGTVDYSPDMCPRTLDLLGRAVHLDVSPDLSDQNVAEIVEAVNKVLTAAL